MRLTSIQKLVARLLELDRPSPALLAMRVGVPERTLRAYGAGREEPPADVQERIANTVLVLAPSLAADARRLLAQIDASRKVRNGTVRGSMTRPMGEWT
jgi:hypothetical protein